MTRKRFGEGTHLLHSLEGVGQLERDTTLGISEPHTNLTTTRDDAPERCVNAAAQRSELETTSGLEMRDNIFPRCVFGENDGLSKIGPLSGFRMGFKRRLPSFEWTRRRS